MYSIFFEIVVIGCLYVRVRKKGGEVDGYFRKYLVDMNIRKILN